MKNVPAPVIFVVACICILIMFFAIISFNFILAGAIGVFLAYNFFKSLFCTEVSASLQREVSYD